MTTPRTSLNDGYSAPQETESRSRPPEHPALIGLQQWLLRLYSAQLAKYDEQGVVHVVPEVARRFGLGVVDDNAFIAFEKDESGWASKMPWEYAAIYQGKRDLYLVASPLEFIDGATPPFGLSFEMRSVVEAQALHSYGILELRRSLVNISDARQTRIISREAFAELPIYLLEEGEPIFGASEKRQNRASHQGGRK
jgi:hypothetical protein